MTYPWQRPANPSEAPIEMGQRFFQAWSATPTPDGSTLELLPDRLTSAAVAVLDTTDAAGVSIINRGLRVPLGASNAPATVAERLQFTVGDGPCLTAATTGAPVQVTGAEIAARWPVLCAQLIQRSPFRSVLSVPIQVGDSGGAVDFYFTDSSGSTTLKIVDATAVAGQIGDVLAYTAGLTGQADTAMEQADLAPSGPPWLYGPTPTHRMRIWIAIGMLTYHLPATAADALDILRGYAYTHDVDIDDLASNLLDGTLALDQITED